MSFQLYLFSPVVVWAMCFGGISLVLPFPVLDFFLLPPLFRISLSGYLMWIVWQRYLSRLSCLQGYSLWVHNQIFTFYYAKICRLKTASNIESHRLLMYNLCFYKYTECRDKCKLLYLIVLHIRVVLPLSSLFAKYPLSDTTHWVIGRFRMDVTECLLKPKIVAFLEFLWYHYVFCVKGYDSLEKVCY